MVEKEKLRECIASSYKDLMAMPPDLRRRFGYALSLAQMGDQDDAAKALKGFGCAGGCRERQPFVASEKATHVVLRRQGHTDA